MPFLLPSTGLAGSQRRLVLVAAFTLALSFVWTLRLYGSSTSYTPVRSPQSTSHQISFDGVSSSQLHLLVVGTQANINFCRLLLSANVLQYPVPIIVDWNGTAEFDAAASHLAKVHGILRYLESLPAARDDDLALVVDGYDVLFQLPPDILLKRYFAINEAANARLMSQFSAKTLRAYDIRQTTFWGPDKTCWPTDDSRPACWAVPDSTLPPKAFGLHTDNGDMANARPRWVNSGTLIGPVGDLRVMLRATKAMIELEHDTLTDATESDQRYFADVWGEQEYARLLLRKEAPAPRAILHNAEERKWSIPPITPHPVQTTASAADPGSARNATSNSRPADSVEYHVGLDYESLLFQTNAASSAVIEWFSYNNTPKYGFVPVSWSSSSNKKTSPALSWSHATYAKTTHLDLQRDVDLAPPPFAALNGSDPSLANLTWHDVELGTNVATHNIFALFHATGFKEYLDKWWARLWFLPYADALHRAVSSLDPNRPISANEVIGGKIWYRSKDDEDNMPEEIRKTGKRPARADTGEWLAWDGICGAFEDELYHPKPWFNPEPELGLWPATPVDPEPGQEPDEKSLSEEGEASK